MLLGFLVWGDVPTALVLVSAAVVIGCGIYLLLDQKAAQMRNREEPEPGVLPPGS